MTHQVQHVLTPSDSFVAYRSGSLVLPLFRQPCHVSLFSRVLELFNVYWVEPLLIVFVDLEY